MSNPSLPYAFPLMDAREALRQIALQALLRPDFDRSTIPDADELIKQLQQDSTVRSSGTPEPD